jgi:hypothetical protein
MATSNNIQEAQPIQPIHSWMRAILYLAGALVFISGFQLFVLSDFTAQYFAWTVKPSLTAATLGAAYWASCVLEFAAARKRIWAHARIAVPAVLLFTSLTLVVTILHADRFHLADSDPISRNAAWAWLIIYVWVPPLLGGIWLLQARVTGTIPARGKPLHRAFAACLALMAIVLIPIGLGMLIAPQSVIPVWPWVLTPLTARAIGAWAFALGFAMIHALWENDWERVQIATWSIATFGLLELLALIRYPADMKWELPQAWFYTLFMALIALAGTISIIVARRRIAE